MVVTREGIMVALDRHLVVYPGGAVVDKGAGVEDIIQEVPLLHRPILHRHLHNNVFYTGTSIA